MMTKIIKLVNDHEIIGDLIHEDNDSVILDNPFSIHYMTSSRSDRPIIGLLRYMPFADRRDIVFGKRDIINCLDARKSMIGYYKTVVENYVKYVDENIDNELESVAEEERAAQNQQELSPAEVMATFLSRLTNDKMH
jgi:hypothetical protein